MRLRTVIAPALCFAAGVAGATAFSPTSLPATEAAIEKAPAKDAIDTGLAEAARAAYEGYVKLSSVSPEKVPPETLYRWSMRWLEAESAAAEATKRAVAYTSHFERMRALENYTELLVKSGNASKVDLTAVKYYVAEAELLAKRAKGK